MSKRIDLTGQRFGRLVVEGFAYVDKHKNAVWNCKCDCGATVTVNGNNLKKGNTKSCGCLNRETRAKRFWKHGGSHERLHSIWKGMIARTERENHINYNNYGGRDIKVCKQWRENFKKFYDWSMGHGYKDGLTIDRIDTNGDYCPENCRWVTMKEQNNNKRSNIKIEYKGEILTLTQWSERLGIGVDTLRARLYRLGWTVEKTFETPIDERKGPREK